MSKSLLERIETRQKSKSCNKAKSEFIAQQNDIAKALDAGFSMKAIWETLADEDKISFGYKAFRNYVIKLIHSQNETPKEENKQKSKTKPDSKISAFTYNPVPNPEELF